MTNKTVTLSRELVDAAAVAVGEWGDSLLSRCNPGHGTAMLDLEREIRDALADPVPPAGAELEVERFDMFIESGSMEQTKGGAWVYHDDHHAHVTRLQAEVGRLNGELQAATDLFTTKRSVNRKLQSELTKARELLSDAPRGVPGFFQWGRDVIAFLAHQSAPAAKHECTSCDGSGDLIDAIGDWRGYCSCPAGVELKARTAPADAGGYGDDAPCAECGQRDCNGQCYGDDMMGDS
ncbi:UNVERIFIED_ORG: hypothetical protein J2Y77_005817 [Pseudomonas lini]